MTIKNPYKKISHVPEHSLVRDFAFALPKYDSIPFKVQIKCLLIKARPEPDFKYFSNSNALYLFSVAK